MMAKIEARTARIAAAVTIAIAMSAARAHPQQQPPAPSTPASVPTESTATAPQAAGAIAPGWGPQAGMATYSAPANPLPSAAPTPRADSAVAPGWEPQTGTATYTSSVNPPPSAAPTIDGVEADAVSPTKSGLTPGERAFEETKDDSYLDSVNWAVMVYKSRHKLVAYYKGRLYRAYHAVFGRSLESGAKLYEGDRRTPEGVYTIVQKYPSRRWRWFLRLNYPNMLDRRRYDNLRDHEVLPVAGGRVVGAGGRIGIHGTDNPRLNRDDVNWTTGCISVDNTDISELNRILPIGTVVIIRP